MDIFKSIRKNANVAAGLKAGKELYKKIENEISKKEENKQSSSYCQYVYNNIEHINQLVEKLETETKSFVSEFSSKKLLYKNKTTRITSKEKEEIRKLEDAIETNLSYLYLTRDFFAALSKKACGLPFSNVEKKLITKFLPFFNGVPVLEMDDEYDEEDDSLLGMAKELGNEFKEILISSNNNLGFFTFEDYLDRYCDSISDLVIPDCSSAISSFKNSMSANAKKTSANQTIPTKANSTDTSHLVECPNCHSMVKEQSKFCSECGFKIEKKKLFCAQCGSELEPDAKFCASCGSKVK